ncbi:hypothetical protein DENSPDRAFT_807343 [Dentipellis sp. KUC8613]|nr:hypothetical protein DENSPDRAFT_807343 [Dentipellis sp. KUC8613]
MVLKILYNVIPAILPPKYYTHVVVAVVGLITVYTYMQGRKTTRERDLHDRTILVTGAFTPIGLTLLDALAKRGAHIITLSPTPIDTGLAALLIPLLRSTTSNENIYAEHCDLSSPASIRAFATGFLKAEKQRLDAVVFAHEYAPAGRLFPQAQARADERAQAASCATFLLTTLLLPALLIAPVERDIRLITLVNPFYAAAAPGFTASITSASTAPASASSASRTRAAVQRTAKEQPLFLREGRRALRTAVLMRHLQRVLDSLPSGAQVPRTDANAQTIPVVSDKVQRSNIVAVSVSPGMSRADVVAPLLGADTGAWGEVSWRGLALYVLLYPLLRLLTKTSFSAMQAVLHALFLPTPFKYLAAATTPESTDADDRARDAEVLKPGALYAECAVVRVRVAPAPAPPETDSEPQPQAGKSNAEPRKQRVDDGEMGGEVLGTMVWEEYERELKAWEAAEKEREEREKSEGEKSGRHTPPTVDVDTPVSG